MKKDSIKFNKIRECVDKIFEYLEKFSNYLKFYILPIFILELKISFVFFFFFFIGLLTQFGIRQELNNDFNNLLSLLASIIGTIIAITFSLIILPIQHIASKYSPKFLRYILKDSQSIISFITFSLILLYYITFIYVGSSPLIISSAILLFIFSLLVLWLLIRHIIKISNPYFSILIPAYEKITKEVDKAIPRFYKNCKKGLKKYEKEGVKSEKYDLCKFKVDKKIIEYIKGEILPVREIAAKSIRGMDLEMSENSLRIITSIIIRYFQARIDYQDDQDPILFFIYEEFEILSNLGSKDINLRLHPFIIDCWIDIGIQVSKINLGDERMVQNINVLVSWPVKALKDLCLKNFIDQNSYAPTKACNALGDIGVQLMIEGYDNQAAEIVKELSVLSKLAIENNLNHITSSANYAVMRIYYAGIINRNRGYYDGHNTPYKQINENINEIILAGLKKKSLNTFDSQIFGPFFGPTWNILDSLNFSRISEVALFSKDLTKDSLEMNLECIEQNINTLNVVLYKLKEHKDWYFSGQALRSIHMTLLHLLAYINISMAKDHILFYKKEYKVFVDEKLEDRAIKIVKKSVNMFTKFSLEKFDRHLFEKEHLSILMTIFFIILYENKVKKNSVLDDLFDYFVDELYQLLKEYKKLKDSDSNDELYKYYRLLKKVLKENNFDDIDKKFDVPEFKFKSAGFVPAHKSEYPKTMFDGKWILKRPEFQVNTFYYNRVEKALKLDELKFY